MRAPIGTALLCLSLALVACADDEDSPTCSGVKLDRPVLVLESDYQASGLGRIDEDGCFTEVADLALGTDPRLSDAHGRPFVSVRDQGVLHEIDRNELRIVNTVSAFADGEPQPNPWDVDVDTDGRLWVARYDVSSVAVIGPDGSLESTVDLSKWADADGNPDMSAVRVVGDRVFVALEHLLNDENHVYAQTGPGTVVVIDVAPPHAVVSSFALPGRNPFSRLVPVPDEGEDAVLVALPGDNDQDDAGDGIAMTHLATGDGALIASEVDLGGSALETVIAPRDGPGGGEVYAIVEGPVPGKNPTRVLAFDVATGAVTRTFAGAPAFVHAGLAVVGGYLLVGDRTPGAATIHVFDRASGKEVGALAPRRLPPVSLLAL